MSLLNVLLEGKKENLIDKYKDSINVEDFETLLSDLIDKDPSATKKYSEWMVKELIRLYNSATRFDSLPDIINFMGEQIQRFHELSNSITDNDVEYFLKQIDSYNSRGIKYFEGPYKQDQIKRSPKDIYAYPSIWVVQLMNNSIEERKKLQQEEEEAKKDVEKIYEDNRFLIVQPFTHKASCFYGANSKWCTASRNDDYNFRRYTRDGRLYYIIDKEASGNRSMEKMALHITNDGNATAWDQQDSNRGIDFMYERFAPIANILKKLVNGDDDYEKLKKAKEGNRAALKDRLSAEYFDSMDSEYVYFSFDDVEDYLSLYENEADEYQIKDVAYAVETPYGYDSYYYDAYNFDDDLKEGYPIYRLNSNHLIKLKKILEILGSDLVGCLKSVPSFDVDKLKKFVEKGNDKKDYYDLFALKIKSEGNCESKIGSFLRDIDEKFVEDFSYAYSSAMDEAMKQGVRKAVKDELCNFYSGIGFEQIEDGCLSNYKMSIDKLIEFYEDDLESNSGLTIDQMIKDILVPNLVSGYLPEPREMAYEHEDEETFDYHFNDDMDRALDNFLERIEDSEEYADLEQYQAFYTYITNKYGFGEWKSIPTSNDGTLIKFVKIDPTDNRIEFELMRRGENYGFKKGKAKLSTIQNMFSNYQLFDLFDD